MISINYAQRIGITDTELFKDIRFHFLHLLPNNEGKDKAAGPGPWNSAAIGPLLLVGVQEPLCPPMFLFSSY